MELRAERGRAVLVGTPEQFEPPSALAGALDEWAEVAAAVCADDSADPQAAALVSARGRQLAARLAAAAGTPVRYTDPVYGVLEQVPAGGVSSRRAPDQSPADPDGGTTGYPTGRTAEDNRAAGGSAFGPMPAAPDHVARAGARGLVPAEPVDGAVDPRAAAERPPAGEPTPWVTGLAVSGFVAVVVLFALVALVRGLGAVAWPLGALGLVVVTAGLAPSVWLARHTPLWRWVSYGVAAGVALSWVIVALSTLGPGAS